MEILDELGKKILFCDGGLGSLLQERGLKPGELPETWNLTKPEVLIDIHKAYLEAGADIINANTFGANRFKFDNLEEIITAGINNAKQAVKESGRNAYVALDMGSCGKLLKPMGTLDFEEAVDVFAEVIRIGDKAGADLILIETMSDTYELKAIMLAAKENSSLPVMATVVFDEKGKLLTGATPEAVVALLEGLGADAIGINCGLGPKQLRDVFERMTKCASVPLIINPNAGLPRSENGKTVYDVGPEEFAADMEELIRMGAAIAGGCCGTTPAHIKALTDRCKGMEVPEINEKDITLVSSYSHAVEIGKVPVIIGERINPTGKSKFKQALRDHNMNYILEEGVKQADSGAHILDVNVGLPEIDEPAMMKDTVYELQSILDLPLQIDTTDVTAMEAAMRIYNGKPMINSVNGKTDVMEAVFPLVAKYGGVVVGLTLDENGIPDTAEGRLAIADKIYAKAAEYGIKAKDIVIDALTMTMSTDDKSADITLETVREIARRGGRTVLGVSNISFGLPQRELITSAFYTMAMNAGLSAGIINPNSKLMMQAYDTFMVLSGNDSQCGRYIEKYAVTPEGEVKATTVKAEGMSLTDSIIKGFKDQAYEKTVELLKTKEAMAIINEDLVPALDTVGKGFEKGTMFLPQLLMSADAAKAGFEAIKEVMSAKGSADNKKATIVIATVKGDIHDIGKNIVKVLLENYSYDVIDLGKDVSPEVVVAKVKETKAPLVGLSALMTTTVVNMEETIKELRKECPWCKIMVGGAVLTKEYADMIGADFYGKDAMQSVYYAEKLFG